MSNLITKTESGMTLNVWQASYFEGSRGGVSMIIHSWDFGLSISVFYQRLYRIYEELKHNIKTEILIDSLLLLEAHSFSSVWPWRGYLFCTHMPHGLKCLQNASAKYCIFWPLASAAEFTNSYMALQGQALALHQMLSTGKEVVNPKVIHVK